MKKKISLVFNKLYKYIENNLMKILYVYLFFIVLLIIFALKQGDDIMFHLQRMEAVINEVKNSGIKAFPIRIYHSTAGGYGYGSPLFYCDLFLWPFAIIASAFNISTVLIYKFMLCVVLIAIFLISNYSFSLVFKKKDKEISLFLYIFSVTLFSNATGSWVGRYFAMMFAPLCVCSFYCLLENKDKLKFSILLAIGVTGTIFSNVIDAVIIVFVLLVYMIFNIKKLNIRIILYILLSVSLCFLLSSWFILPMIEQMLSQTLFVTSDKVNLGINDLGNWTIPLLGYIFPRETTSAIVKILNINSSNIPDTYFEGILFYILIIAIIIIYRKKYFKIISQQESKSYLYASIVLLLLFIVFQTKLFPHKLFANLIGVIQFPWRVNIVMSVLAIFIVININKTINNRIAILMVSFSMLLTLLTFMSSYGHDIARIAIKNKPFADYSFNSYNVGTGEYLPIELFDENNIYSWGSKLNSRTNEVICSNDNVLIDYKKTFDSIYLDTSNVISNSKIELPLIYYYGYKAIEPVSNKEFSIEKSKMGLVQINVDDNFNNIEIYYGGTELQKISNYISIGGIIVCVILIYINKNIYARGK